MIPTYDELPLVEGLGLPHAWDVLERDLGSLSLIEPEHRLAAAAEIRIGESLSLNLPLDMLDPPLFGRPTLRHRVIEVGRNTFEDVLDNFNPQSSSQWDGLRHVRAREYGFFGGLTSFDHPSSPLGIGHWARQGIVGRGVLLDVGRWSERQGSPIDPFAGDEIDVATLEACAIGQGVTLRTGDIVCIRTGWVSAYRVLDATGRGAPELSERFSGLRADADMARFVWDHGIAAICVDNPALESAPGDPGVGSLHRRLIPLLGTAVAELLDLDLLARRCDELQRWTFLFAAVPLPLPDGVSSPSNALAVL